MNTNEIFAIVDKVVGVLSNAVNGATEAVKPIAAELLHEISVRGAIMASIEGVLALLIALLTAWGAKRTFKNWKDMPEGDAFLGFLMVCAGGISTLGFTVAACLSFQQWVAPMLYLINR